MLRLYQTLILQTNLAVRSGYALADWSAPAGPCLAASGDAEETTYAYETWKVNKFRPN